MNDMTWNPNGFNRHLPADLADTDAPRREIRLGLILGGGFFLGLLGWAALTPLDAGAMASGVVAVAGNRQSVQHTEGGMVTSLMATEGQTVRKGQSLLTVAAPDLVGQERALTAEVIGLVAQQARLTAERDRAGAIPRPAEFASLPIADRGLASEAMRVQALHFDSRRAAIAAERSVLAQRAQQHSKQIGGFGAQLQSSQEQLQLIDEELAGLRALAARGFVSKTRIRAIERDAAQMRGSAGALRADISRSGEAIGETRLQSASLDLRMLEEVAGELRAVQVRLFELRPRLAALRERLALATVRAPASGRIVGLNVHTVGGVVSPGNTLMEIVPQDRALVVDARLAPNDADDVRPGQAAQVRFSGIQERNLPILNGTITKMSADSFEDERSGQRYFKIEVRVNQSELAKVAQVRDGRTGLQSGLPAEVLVPLRKRSALAYLVEPITQSLWRAGREH
jgi:HlyD family secretion protein